MQLVAGASEFWLRWDTVSPMGQMLIAGVIAQVPGLTASFR